MAGLLKRILSSITSSPRGRELTKNRARRSLKIEPLEGRSLMALDLAVIAGNAFIDTNSNSTFDSGVDTAVGNATIQLYRDANSNNTFDLLTDTLVATATSNATTGAYQFASTNAGGVLAANTITAGTYFVRQLQSGSLSPPTPTVVTITNTNRNGAQVQVIDPFSTTAQSVVANSGTPTASSAIAAPEAIGGTRTLIATYASGAQSLAVDVIPGAQILTYNSGFGVDGSVLVQYDGDTNAGTFNRTGLGSQNLRGSSTTASLAGIQLSVLGDQANAQAFVRIFTNATDFSTATIQIPTSSTNQDVFVPFSQFVNSGAGADFTNVGAIEVEIDGVVQLDASVQVVRSVRPDPVTSNLQNTQSMSIGNLVFRDLDSNRDFNGADVGIGNVRVELYNDVNNNSTFESGTDTLVTFTTTATSGTIGSYVFTGLAAGNYVVVIPSSQFGTGQPLLDHRVSGTAGPLDTNNRNQGTLATGGNVFAPVSLTLGAEPTNDGDTDNNTNLTVDFGFTNTTLQLTKTDTPDPVIVGGNLTYTLTATNNGPSSTTNTIISDPVPTGFTVTTATFTVAGGPSQNATNTAGTVSTPGFTLASGQNAVLTIVGTVGSTFVTGTTNTGTVDSDQTDAVTSQAQTAVTPNIDLAIDKSIVGGVTTVGLGGTLTYRLTLTNTSGSTVTNVQVFDDLPAGFTPGTLPTGVVAGTAPNDLIWTITSIAANGTATVDIPVNVTTAATVGTGRRNTATINIAGLTGFNDTNTANNTDFIDVTVEPRYDLLVTKTNNATAVTTGQTITYTITVNNNGPSDATNVQVTDTLPAALEFISAQSNNTNIGTITGQAYSATLATLASGATTTISLVARVRANATGTNVANTVNIAADNPTQETGTRANTATDTDPLTRVVTLNINKDDSADPVVAGGANFNYIVTAFNSGSADAPNVLFSDPLPTGVTFVSGTFEVNETTSRNGTVTFNSTTNRLEANLGTLLAGGTSTTNRALITLVVRADATAAAGTVNNTATLTSPDNTTGVTNTESTTINRSFDLTVTKQDGLTTLTRGQSVTYTITVTNTGPSAATAVNVSDTLPPNMTFVSATSGFTNANGVITGQIPSINPNASSTVTIVATVSNDAPNGANLTNTVTVNSAGETNTANNTATDTSTVASTANLSGRVYVDSNGNGVRDTNEPGIAGVTMTVTGTATSGGASVTRTTTTDANGEYTFSDLPVGTYSVSQTQPNLFSSVSTNVGTVGGQASGTGSENRISNINLTGNSVLNNFGETILLSKRWFLSSSPRPPQ
jgi:uncharacterized repeat protein (TIGR01451 family)